MLNLLLTVLNRQRTEQTVPAFADYIHGPDSTPAFLDRLAAWLALTIIFVLIAYGPVFFHFIQSPGLPIPGRIVW